MSKERRSDLLIGIILLFLGAWFLAAQFRIVPGINEIINIEYQWPLIIIGVGILIFFLGLISHNPGMSVPACIVSGIGGLLYWTNSTGNWNDWTYLWTLIPGFVGVGTILSSLLNNSGKKAYREGFRLIIVSVILFVLFLILFSGKADLYRYWPVLVILAGIWIIIQTLLSKK